MINLHKLRKTVVLIVWPVFGAMVYYGGLLTGSVWNALLYLISFCFLGFFLGKMLLKNSFSDALEGGGLLAIDLSSKGVLPTFVLKMNGRSLLKDNKIKTHFNRSIVQSMRMPVMEKEGKWWEVWKLIPKLFKKEVYSPETKEKETSLSKSEFKQNEDGGFNINISSEDYQRSRMLVDTLPVIFYNSQSGLFLTKDFLADFEQKTTILHGLVDLYHKLERLENHMLSFGRYVVQAATGEGVPLWRSKGFIIIIILIVLGALSYYLGPPIYTSFKSALGGIKI